MRPCSASSRRWWAGAAGQKTGFAIIQTTDPDNPVLNLAAAQDYDAFFEQEIAYRKLGLYPPFCGLCVVGFAGPKESEVARASTRFAALLGRQAAKQPDLPLRVLGPTPGSIEKINDSYRYKLTVKCRNDRRFRDLIRETLTLYEQEKLPGKATVVVDVWLGRGYCSTTQQILEVPLWLSAIS